jgi:hypothetical protein
MGFRFRKRVKLFPGFSVNLSKSGTSVSLGGRGATVNFGKRGERVTTSLPGTGISYSKTISNHTPGSRRRRAASPGIGAFIVGGIILWAILHFAAGH